MNRRHFTKALLAVSSTFAAASGASAGAVRNCVAGYCAYQKGDTLSSEIFVTDKDQTRRHLTSLLKDNNQTRVNVLFIFGGGAMGHDSPGGIWCPDSFEDLHILRTLKDIYKGELVGFIFVACAPVFHSRYLGFSDRLFLDKPDESPEFVQAVRLFIDSTQAARQSGIIPQQPYYDLRLRLMMDKSSGKMPTVGKIYDWQGKFRDPAEKQKYGIPNIWLLNSNGNILTEPFRGNMYHPKPGDNYQIKYTVSDVADAISQELG